LRLSNKRTVQFIGIGKEEVKGFWGTVDVRIGGVTYETNVIFSEMSDFGHGILGQKGFFDHFDIKLQYQKQIVAVEQNYKSFS